MNAHKVDYNMELYVPEILFYQQNNIFTTQETEKIVKLREKYEKSICESFCPLLTDYTNYLDHLHATKKLVEDRLRNQIAEGINKEQLSSVFNILNQQIHRIANQMLLIHTENKKTYIWLFRYCIQSSQESLGLIVAKKLTQLYPGYFLGWVFLAKVLETQAGVVEARRTYFLGLQNLRETCYNYSQFQAQYSNNNNNYLNPNFVRHDQLNIQANTNELQQHNIYIKNNGKYAGDALEKDEMITQKLPSDAFVLLYNWYILELQLLLDMGYQQLPEQEFSFTGVQSKDQAIQLLVGGYYLVLIVSKAIEVISKFTSQKDAESILTSNDLFKTFLGKIQEIHQLELFVSKITFSVEEIVARTRVMILGQSQQNNQQTIQSTNFNAIDQLLATDD